MIVALHQPYFFPYIGYFAVINASDIYVHSDTMQYIRHGWINRNRIKEGKDNWGYIICPILKGNYTDHINQVKIDYKQNWIRVFYKKLEIYQKAPNYEEIIHLLEKWSSVEYDNIADMNMASVSHILNYLEIDRKIIKLSDIEKDIDLSEVNEADDWGLVVSKYLKADTYINAPGGSEFYNKEKYKNQGIELKFLHMKEYEYKQGKNKAFIPDLSILDVLMYNSKEKVREMLENYYYE